MFLAARSLWISLLLSRYFMPSQICWPKLERQMMFSVDRRDVSLRHSNKDLENNDFSLSLINNDFLTTCQLFPPHNCLAKFLWFHLVWSSVWGNVNESNSIHKPCVAHFRQISISAESSVKNLSRSWLYQYPKPWHRGFSLLSFSFISSFLSEQDIPIAWTTHINVMVSASYFIVQKRFAFLVKSVPERRQFCDEHDPRSFQDDAEQFHHVRVFDGLHDLVLFHELEHAVLQPVLA